MKFYITKIGIVFLLTLYGCSGAGGDGEQSKEGNKKLIEESVVGAWQSKFDVSNADEMVVGVIGQTKFEYTFKEDKTGERNATVMGMEANAQTTWRMKDDTLYINYMLMKEEKNERFVFISEDKMQLLKESEDVITYLIPKQ